MKSKVWLLFLLLITMSYFKTVAYSMGGKTYYKISLKKLNYRLNFLDEKLKERG